MPGFTLSTNLSPYTDEQLLPLLEYASRGLGLEGVTVACLEESHGAAGKAYYGFARRFGTYMRHAELRFGPPETFPYEVRQWHKRWKKMSAEETEAWSTARRAKDNAFLTSRGLVPTWQVKWDRRQNCYCCYLWEESGYGGSRSPIIEMRDWQEGVVALAAHEFRHLYQFRTGKPRSEVDAERWALKVLTAFRIEREGGDALPPLS